VTTPPVITGTRRNSERTGQRKLTRLSAIARRIEDVRGIDIDYVQYCHSCLYPEIFCEVKRTVVHDGEWRMMRVFARHYGCMAMLCIEPDLGPVGVRVYDAADNSVSLLDWCGEEGAEAVLRMARDRHECR
jgi:hypothetical protein